jgi:hypothetical protein
MQNGTRFSTISVVTVPDQKKLAVLFLFLPLAHSLTKTPHGVLLATSLAHFRSDYAIVHIPDGNFLVVREQLYTNINLLRMGCSGRTALTLEEPRCASPSSTPPHLTQ